MVLDKAPILHVQTKNTRKFRNKNNSVPQFTKNGPFRLTVIGNTGSGKTFMLMSLIGMLSFDTISIYAKNINQPVYEDLLDSIAQVEENIGESISYIGESISEMLKVEEYDADKQNLIIIDDFMTDSNNAVMTDYFIRSRPQNCAVVYLAQAFFNTPKIIREQSNYFILYKGITRERLGQIYRQIGSTVELNDFVRAYNYAIEKTPGQPEEINNFLFIDKNNEGNKLYLRKNFDEPIDLNDTHSFNSGLHQGRSGQGFSREDYIKRFTKR